MKINAICITVVYMETILKKIHTFNSVWENFKCYYSTVNMREFLISGFTSVIRYKGLKY